ncbi:MAG: cobalamin-dependent protein [Syntrophobacteraceae bacterium]
MRRKKKLRVLIAKFGEGYENAMLKLAHDCCEAGFEVIYAGLSDPEAIAVCALQESVDHIGITTLPGATVEDFARLFDTMKRKEIHNVRVTAGGIFPEDDVEKIKRMGVIDFYAGSSIYDRMEKWSAEYGGVQDISQCAKFEPALAGKK